MRKTHDYTYRYQGSWRDGGRCRRDGGCCHIAVYLPEAGAAKRRPAIVATERDDNDGSSVTNMAAYLAAEVVARHSPHLLDTPADEGQPVVWLEHYPPRGGAAAEYDRVTFAPWRIRVDWVGGTLRRVLGTPHWARLDPAAAALLGPPVPGAGGR